MLRLKRKRWISQTFKTWWLNIETDCIKMRKVNSPAPDEPLLLLKNFYHYVRILIWHILGQKLWCLKQWFFTFKKAFNHCPPSLTIKCWFLNYPYAWSRHVPTKLLFSNDEVMMMVKSRLARSCKLGSRPSTTNNEPSN